MLVLGHQVPAGLPGADGINQEPAYVDDHCPDQVVDRRGPVSATADDAVPGHQVFLAFDGDQLFDDGRRPAEVFDQEYDRRNAGEREQQEHQRVGQNDAARARIHREGRVAEPGGD